MNDPRLDLLIKEKLGKYVPTRPLQVLHCGVIVLVSIAIGIFNLSPETAPPDAGAVLPNHGSGAWMGAYLSAAGLTLYLVWTSLRATKARKEANAEFLAATRNRAKRE